MSGYVLSTLYIQGDELCAKTPVTRHQDAHHCSLEKGCWVCRKNRVSGKWVTLALKLWDQDMAVLRKGRQGNRYGVSEARWGCDPTACTDFVGA